MEMSGNTVLATGGATGKGFAMAEYFLKAVNNVIICGRREAPDNRFMEMNSRWRRRL